MTDLVSSKHSSIVRRLEHILAWIAGSALVAMVVIVAVDVVTRRIVPGLNLHGSIELSVLLLIVIGYLGLPWGFGSNAHITIEVATAKAPDGVNRILDSIWLFLSATVSAVLALLVLRAGIDLNTTGQVTEIIRIPPLVPYGICAFGLGVTTIVASHLAFRRATGHAQEHGNAVAPPTQGRTK